MGGPARQPEDLFLQLGQDAKLGRCHAVHGGPLRHQLIIKNCSPRGVSRIGVTAILWFETRRFAPHHEDRYDRPHPEERPKAASRRIEIVHSGRAARRRRITVMRRMTALWLCAIVLAGALAPPALAAPCRNDAPFERWLEDFKREAVTQGVSRQVADSALAGVTFDPGVVSRDRGQGVFSQSFAQFAGRMADGYRLGTGAAKLKQHAAALARAEQQYGVPPQVIVSLWALETDFGIDNGNLPVLRSLD